MTVYILVAASGSYDDYQTENISASLNKEKLEVLKQKLEDDAGLVEEQTDRYRDFRAELYNNSPAPIISQIEYPELLSLDRVKKGPERTRIENINKQIRETYEENRRISCIPYVEWLSKMKELEKEWFKQNDIPESILKVGTDVTYSIEEVPLI